LTVCSISLGGFISKTGIGGDMKGIGCGIISADMEGLRRTTKNIEFETSISRLGRRYTS
jgi:hypothetical protein